MTDNMIELGKRAVACCGWKWMRGMNTTTGDTFIAFADADEAYWLAHPDDPCEVDPIAGLLPDLSDPATLGCLLALVREAWGDASKLWNGYVEVQRDHQSLFFVVQFKHDASGALVEDTLATGGTEAEAHVAALEGAP